MPKALTSKSVAALKPDPQKRRELPDPALSGLYMVVQPSGAKSWALRYRFNGRPKKLTLGRWPKVGVADARTLASEALEEIAHGTDPGQRKKQSTRVFSTERGPEEKFVSTLFDEYSKRHLAGLKSGAEVRRRMEVEFLPFFGDRQVDQISKAELRALLEAIADTGRGTTSNRVRLYISGFLNWCVERDAISVSPLLGLKGITKEKARDRVLSEDEIRWFWHACESVGDPWCGAGKMLLLTGQRLNEVLGMTSTEIDGATWNLGPTRTKNGRAHSVPLSHTAQCVLSQIDPVLGDLGLFFTTTGNTPISGYFKARNRLHKIMLAYAKAERGEQTEIPHWTFHDLRRTTATGMAKLGIPVRVTEAVLNHVSGTAAGIVSVYQRHDYADEKRDALQEWAQHIQSILKNP